MLWVGIDTGGTFTDLVAYDSESGNLTSLKTPSTPDDHARGVIAAVEATGFDLGRITGFSHGTTVATNTALEHKGAKLGVITTHGHRDVLVIGRGNRTQLYDITAVRPAGIVERHHVMEVEERCTVDGEVLKPLDEAQVEAACTAMLKEGIEAVAVCFLHAYANPEHERRAAEIARRMMPDAHVCASHEILPEYREFERFSTTALNAYVAPRTGAYLNRLADQLTASGLKTPVRVMASNGGTWPAARMAEHPANALLSGPAGGVIAATALSQELGIKDIITYDMGGTSTDACMIRDGQYGMNPEGMVGWYPNRVPQIDINTVGAGGGSIAYLEAGNFLNVGPRSAGAEPGPACYGKGGTEPTVTDANVVLGRFQPTDALGGAIHIDQAAARTAVMTVADQLGLSAEAMAEGIIRLAVIRMTASVKEISVMRGIDPRDFALVAFGGAGPMHGAFLAEELGMTRVVIPPLPGNFSAFGLLVADTRHDVARTEILSLENTNLDEVRSALAPLVEEACVRLTADGFDRDTVRIETSLDMRYVGQAFELNIPLPEDATGIDELLEAFHQTYEERYSHRDRGLAEVVAFRVAGFGAVDQPPLPSVDDGGDLTSARRGIRAVVFDGKAQDTAVYWRGDLPLDTAFDGPAIIEESGSTTVIPPGFKIRMDRTGSLILDREASA
jgi:N-methylhydantoinase A